MFQNMGLFLHFSLQFFKNIFWKNVLVGVA